MSKSLKITLLLTFLSHILRGQNGYQNLDTSSEGNAENNQRLSERRAEAVKNYLVQKGIAPERLETKGFGATQPVSIETTEENRRLNRRIEFEVQF